VGPKAAAKPDQYSKWAPLDQYLMKGMLRFCWRAALVTLAISATSPGCAVDFGNPHRLISLHDNTSISSGQSGQFCQQETVPHLFIQIVFMRLIKFFYK
jgi:hypothetical protein